MENGGESRPDKPCFFVFVFIQAKRYTHPPHTIKQEIQEIPRSLHDLTLLKHRTRVTTPESERSLPFPRMRKVSHLSKCSWSHRNRSLPAVWIVYKQFIKLLAFMG